MSPSVRPPVRLSLLEIKKGKAVIVIPPPGGARQPRCTERLWDVWSTGFPRSGKIHFV